jgi:predicted dehydrogenase
MTGADATGSGTGTRPRIGDIGTALRIGFIGAGAVALEHARAAKSLGHQIVMATCRSRASPRWQAFSAANPECQFVSSLEILADDVDVIIACPSWDEIPRRLDAYLSLPRRCLIEKPIALDAAVLSRAIGDLRGRPNLPAKAVGMNRRFYEPVVALRGRLVEGGLKSVEVTISEDVAGLVRLHGPSILPHVLTYSSCHVLDLALFLFGPLSVQRLRRTRSDHDGQPFMSVNGLLETAAGVPVFLAINDGDPSPVGIRCRFDDKTCWHLSPIERLVVYEGFEVIPADEIHRIRRFVPMQREMLMVSSAFKPGFLAQMAAFAAGGGDVLARPEDSLILLELIEQLLG